MSQTTCPSTHRLQNRPGPARSTNGIPGNAHTAPIRRSRSDLPRRQLHHRHVFSRHEADAVIVPHNTLVQNMSSTAIRNEIRDFLPFYDIQITFTFDFQCPSEVVPGPL